MYYILRILQITFGDSWKAIQFAIRKAIQIAIQKRANAIQNAVQDGKKAIHCHTKCHTRWQKSHTVQQKSHTAAIQNAILYSKNAIRLKSKKKTRRNEMEKLKRTYRLSEQAVSMVENRDREKYPSATDFLEAKILAPTENITELLNKVSIQLDEIKLMVAQEHQKKAEEHRAFY